VGAYNPGETGGRVFGRRADCLRLRDPEMPLDDIAFLKGSELLEYQPDTMLRAVMAQGQVRTFGAGEYVFHQGDAGDQLFIVKSGVLEVLTTRPDGTEPIPIAYLGVGEVIGEIALLTGSPRSATIRSPEHAELFTLERAVFLDLMESLPAFSRNLCLVLARRLEATTLKVPRAATKQLQGNLRFFDLATVIQTLISAHQTGTLVVTQDSNRQKVAEIVFLKGNVARAKVRHLSGDDALFQLFQAPLEGDFSFAGRNVAEEEVQSDITMPAISLLMESVRLQDELPLLMARIPDALRVYRQKAAQLAWQDAETVEQAAAVWARLKKGASPIDLQREIPRCTYAIYRTLVTLLDGGQIE
jgi:CRP/FNR family cyclic AMP-dependent transcriptional regulator